MSTAPSTPRNFRLYAVGDLHGRLDLLTRLLATIEADADVHADREKRLIFLGDYIDRGLDSCGVLQRLTEPFGSGLLPVFLRGNHDDCLLHFLKGRFDQIEGWLQLGGAATIASYGVNPYALGAGIKEIDKLRRLQQEFLAAFPRAHYAFLENTLFSVAYGDYYFVHAGVKPGVPLARQKPEDQMWIRTAFLAHEGRWEKTIIHGHSIQTAPDRRAGRIGIDTGAYASGHLTCLILDGTSQAFLST